MTLATLIVTALATAALAFVGIVQIRTSRAENKRRNGRLDAATNYYAMLVRRSLLETVCTLNQVLSKEDPTWRNKMNHMSAALGNVKKDIEEMLKAAIERHGGSHSDRKKAKTQAYELLAALKSEEPLSEPDRLTLTMLFDNYTKSPAFQDKAERTQREDKRKLDRVIAFLGRNREVRSLSEYDVTKYVQHPKREVRDRAVEADLVALRTALNWATRQRTGHGEPLLSTAV